ncbi:hypothetical protein L5M43_03820 [Shewanella sp. SW36]|uniref:hypothetical protein n=1 Tax=Shewanella TaxID=22 RepID=UPI002005B6E9|nr:MULTISPECIES: hypothetical protein [Shewanella]MCK7634444.1 hypothetical protein [Shewanella sp. JNE17]MCK7649556.1 hypothetical protein [Shewanella sp. JNE8]MCK7657873.1 hypothetical protein [Shewanella sp. JNE4-2]MCS6229653.1 hypothetical protein [Shewanella baltica]MCU7974403.1 hypothetical protein [Shewanella sp. SW36]
MEYIDIVTKLIGGLAAIFGIALTLSHLFAQKSTGRLKKFEIYKEIKTYLDEPSDKNFPVICVAFSCLISRNLTLDESKWFINTPHAFNHLKAYSDQARYIEISEKKDSFRYVEKYSRNSARLYEHIKLIGAYILSASIGIIIMMVTHSKSDNFFISFMGYLFGGVFIFLGIVALLQDGHLSSARSTIKHKFKPFNRVTNKSKKSSI